MTAQAEPGSHDRPDVVGVVDQDDREALLVHTPNVP
jgi:hypothetical protein